MELQQTRPARLAPGTVVADRYKVIGRIGQGGVSTVYEVEHLALAKRFAMKLIRWQKSHQAPLIERLKREAVAISKIGHPNIVTITDLGTTEDGQVFYVMELLEGVTLAWMIAHHGAFSMSSGLSVLSQVAHALVAAHRAGIVHRDLKPANIMLERVEDPHRGVRGDLVKILDFGLAKSITPSDLDLSLTQQGVAVGTLGYVAPEQLAGQEIDVRADIYSMGCIAFEMFAASTPFPGAPMQVALAHLKQTAPLVRERTPLARITDPLEQLIARCLAKAPQDRPQQMSDVLSELRRIARISLTPEGRTWVDLYLPDVGSEPDTAVKDPPAGSREPSITARSPAPMCPEQSTPSGQLLLDPPTPSGQQTIVDVSVPAAETVVDPPRLGAVDSKETTLLQGAVSSEPKRERPAAPSQPAGRRCLLLESDLELASSIEACLRPKGYAVLRPSLPPTLDRLVEVARAQDPELVLVSVELPALSGYAICTRFKKDQRLGAVPLVLMTWDPSDDVFRMHQTLPTRADAYLSKPFGSELLLTTLDGVRSAPRASSTAPSRVEERLEQSRAPTEQLPSQPEGTHHRSPLLMVMVALVVILTACLVVLLARGS